MAPSRAGEITKMAKQQRRLAFFDPSLQESDTHAVSGLRGRSNVGAKIMRVNRHHLII